MIKQRVGKAPTTFAANLLRHAAWRKAHFVDGQALRSTFFACPIGVYDEAAVRKVRLPNEAVSGNAPDPYFRGRILDLVLRANTTSSSELAESSSLMWPCSLYVQQNASPIIIGQEAINEVRPDSPDIDNAMSSLLHLVQVVSPQNILLPSDQEYNMLSEAIVDAFDHPALGEVMLDGMVQAEMMQRHAAAFWFRDGAVELNAPYLPGEWFERIDLS